MNERFEKLMYESGLIAQGCWDSMDEYDRGAIEKFAELIVRECVIQCEREWIRNGTDSVHNQAIHGCINSIKQHFGVEE